MFEKIPGNVIKDSGECSRRFPLFLSNFAANYYKRIKTTITTITEQFVGKNYFLHYYL